MTTASSTQQRYHRQIILPQIGLAGQERLRQARVAILGVGALGSHVAELLTRAGVGFLRLVDRDVVELTNLQRQALYDEQDLEEGLPKAVAAANHLARVNSDVVIEPIVVDINSNTIEQLVRDVNVIIDGSDNFELRYLVNDVAVKYSIPWIYGGVVATMATTMTIRPGITPCLRCLFRDPPPPGSAPTCDTVGVFSPAVTLITAIQASEAIKILIEDTAACHGSLLQIDGWTLECSRIPLNSPDPQCPCCGLHTFDFLTGPTPSQTVHLCGRDAVQVVPYPPATLSLSALATRLTQVGAVSYNRYVLRLRADRYELTVFPDGRAIVKGTTDPTEARSVYARYIGM
ncbi:ThiF family adenylyltransferase [Thermorudis peleae]|uniref:ThiF family adenylyltransferase n=1 Tax=Thermorudis peleae TaxID=1382356 RepID=UPI00056E9982|nr:ThiF family adenylyltransferase [Thermorudis peleae]